MFLELGLASMVHPFSGGSKVFSRLLWARIVEISLAKMAEVITKNEASHEEL